MSEPTGMTRVLWVEIHLGLSSVRLSTLVWGSVCLEKNVGRCAVGKCSSLEPRSSDWKIKYGLHVWNKGKAQLQEVEIKT